MKRTIVILLLLPLIFICSSSNAEEFILRNGITFGDSMEEVMAKETLGIESIDNEYEVSEDYPYSLATQAGNIAGIDDSTIYYYFDANKQLKEVVYYLGSSSSSFDIINAQYKNVNDILIQKYGDPLDSINGHSHGIMGDAILGALRVINIVEAADGIGDILAYDEWIAAGNEYNVKVEHVEYYILYKALAVSQTLSYTYYVDTEN